MSLDYQKPLDAHMRPMFAAYPFPDTAREEDVLVEEKVEDLYKLVVYNDDVNTFEHVTDVLQEVCGHTPEQAEQCTLIIHYKGKCCVKEGNFDDLLPMRTGITDHGINAEIE